MANDIESGIVDTIISDNLLVYVIKKKTREVLEFRDISGRSQRWYVCEGFQNDVLQDHRWKEFWDEESDPNLLWTIMEEIITVLIYIVPQNV